MDHHKQIQLYHTDKFLHKVKVQLNKDIKLEYKEQNITLEYNVK